MKIEIWWDPVCPWCYLGKMNVEGALARYDASDEVDVTWRAFQLDPEAPTEPGPTSVEIMAPYSSEQAVLDRFALIAELGREHGLELNLPTARPVNSRDAHRVALLAQDRGRFTEFSGALLHAHHTQNRNIADHVLLADLAESAGVDRTEAERVLAGHAYADRVLSDRARGRQLGVGGVPTFVIDDRVCPRGSHSVDDILAFMRAAASRSPSPVTPTAR